MSSFFPGISKTISDTKIILLYIESPCPREYLDQNLLTSENRPNMTLSVPRSLYMINVFILISHIDKEVKNFQKIYTLYIYKYI